MPGQSDAEAAELGEAACEGNALAHQEQGALWWDKLGRIDRAIQHFRRAWELGRTPNAMAALRAIATSLGDEATVRALYEEELAATEEPARRATLARELGLLHARSGEAEAAAPLLEQALALAPDDATRERLAEVYAALGEPRAISLCVELAAARRRAGDLEGAAT